MNIESINDHPSMSFHMCLDFYKVPEDIDEWKQCPKCGLKPKVWVYDNGRSTGCGCGRSLYDHFSVFAESIGSVVKRTGGKRCSEYDRNGLKNNWNTYCETGEIVFHHASLRTDGKW